MDCGIHVTVAVGVWVAVLVGDGVRVGVFDAVGDGVGLEVFVEVGVLVGVAVLVAVRVGVGVLVGVGVSVGSGNTFTGIWIGVGAAVPFLVEAPSETSSIALSAASLRREMVSLFPENLAENGEIKESVHRVVTFAPVAISGTVQGLGSVKEYTPSERVSAAPFSSR